MTITITFTLDAEPTTIAINDVSETLVDVLRKQLRKTGTHVGCRNGDCGACTVLINGDAYKSCLVPAWRVEGLAVETIQGIASTDGVLHPVQQAFRDEDGFQCGFCLAGPVMCMVSLLRADPAPSEDSIVASLTGNLCRCTGYQQIMTAARSAASNPRADGIPDT